MLKWRKNEERGKKGVIPIPVKPGCPLYEARGRKIRRYGALHKEIITTSL